MHRKFTPEELSEVTNLSPREAEALQLLDKYHGDERKVADEMGIAPATVYSMKTRIKKKSDTAARTIDAVKDLDGYEPNFSDRI